MVAIRVRVMWVDKVYEVIGEIFGFFKEHFAYSVGSRPTADGVTLPCLFFIVETESLSTWFTLEKLDEVVSRINGSKVWA